MGTVPLTTSSISTAPHRPPLRPQAGDHVAIESSISSAPVRLPLADLPVPSAKNAAIPGGSQQRVAADADSVVEAEVLDSFEATASAAEDLPVAPQRSAQYVVTGSSSSAGISSIPGRAQASPGAASAEEAHALFPGVSMYSNAFLEFGTSDKENIRESSVSSAVSVIEALPLAPPAAPVVPIPVSPAPSADNAVPLARNDGNLGAPHAADEQPGPSYPALPVLSNRSASPHSRRLDKGKGRAVAHDDEEEGEEDQQTEYRSNYSFSTSRPDLPPRSASPEPEIGHESPRDLRRLTAELSGILAADRERMKRASALRAAAQQMHTAVRGIRQATAQLHAQNVRGQALLRYLGITPGEFTDDDVYGHKVWVDKRKNGEVVELDEDERPDPARGHTLVLCVLF